MLTALLLLHKSSRRLKKAVEEAKRKLEQEKEWVAKKLVERAAAADTKLKDKLKELEQEEEEVKKKDEQMQKEKLQPLNVDTLSKDGFQKTLINKPARVDAMAVSDEERDQWYKKFIQAQQERQTRW